MIGITKLYCGSIEESDVLRYGRSSAKLPANLLQFSRDKKPIVVWNCTRRCNLKCVHCYSSSQNIDYEGELSNAEAKAMIDDLAAFGAPVLLFSGGEPLIRDDVIELIDYTTSSGIRAVVSTNGTLITDDIARELKRVGISYVGISLDGIGDVNDSFRGVKGAFKKAMRAVENCKEHDIKVGLRFTMNKRNYHEVPALFDLVEEHGVPRLCFYHLVYSGRGSALIEEDLSHDETRDVVNLIMDRTKDLYDRGKHVEVLTVDNHADGVLLYKRLLEDYPERAEDVYKLLLYNGGNSTGEGIGCVSWDGDVHPDQFWRDHTLGNIREKPFSEIWSDQSNEFLMKLRARKKNVTGRCAACKYLEVCGGNFRARAEAVADDPWAADPACYLTDEEIGVKAE